MPRKDKNTKKKQERKEKKENNKHLFQHSSYKEKPKFSVTAIDQTPWPQGWNVFFFPCLEQRKNISWETLGDEGFGFSDCKPVLILP